jgi:hypothetical protein
MSARDFFRKNKDAIAVSVLGRLLGGLVIAVALFIVAIVFKGGPAVWQWTLRHPTVVIMPLVFVAGILLGAFLKRPQSQLKRLGGPGVRFDRPANLFWLGNDLRYARQMAQYSQRKDILLGLNQASHHSSEVGLKGTAAAVMLHDVTQEVNRLPEAITEPVRARLGQTILSVTEAFSALLKEYQPDFRPNP